MREGEDVACDVDAVVSQLAVQVEFVGAGAALAEVHTHAQAGVHSFDLPGARDRGLLAHHAQQGRLQLGAQLQVQGAAVRCREEVVDFVSGAHVLLSARRKPLEKK